MVEQKLQRYFFAGVGVSFAAVWSLAGFGSAIVCLLAGAACYGASILSQRGTVQELVGRSRGEWVRATSRPSLAASAKHSSRSRRSTARPGRQPVARTEIEPVYSEPDSREALAAQYGW